MNVTSSRTASKRASRTRQPASPVVIASAALLLLVVLGASYFLFLRPKTSAGPPPPPAPQAMLQPGIDIPPGNTPQGAALKDQFGPVMPGRDASFR